MAVFYSFHYDRDAHRVQQIWNIGAVGGGQQINAQEWETVRRRSDRGIEDWINTQMNYKQAVVVLVGAETSQRKWVKYEIQRAIELRKPLLGIRIHGLKNLRGELDHRGEDPFLQMGYYGVPLFEPRGYSSQEKYRDISINLSNWITRGYKRP